MSDDKRERRHSSAKRDRRRSEKKSRRSSRKRSEKKSRRGSRADEKKSRRRSRADEKKSRRSSRHRSPSRRSSKHASRRSSRTRRDSRGERRSRRASVQDYSNFQDYKVARARGVSDCTRVGPFEVVDVTPYSPASVMAPPAQDFSRTRGLSHVIDMAPLPASNMPMQPYPAPPRRRRKKGCCSGPCACITFLLLLLVAVVGGLAFLYCYYPEDVPEWFPEFMKVEEATTQTQNQAQNDLKTNNVTPSQSDVDLGKKEEDRVKIENPGFVYKTWNWVCEKKYWFLTAGVISAAGYFMTTETAQQYIPENWSSYLPSLPWSSNTAENSLDALKPCQPWEEPGFDLVSLTNLNPVKS